MQTVKKNIIALGLAGTALLGADVTSYSGVNVQERTISVKGELVKVTQDGHVIQATLPWKGQNDLKIKYDLQPSQQEILTDKMKKDVIAEQVNPNAFKLDILLNEKPETNKFCYAVEGYENYDFLYQPSLNVEMNDKQCTATDCQGSHRPEELVGSYAIYHKNLRNYKTGDINYETGKVAHIPYPYVWEVGKENKKQRAEDFTYKDGQLCVTVDQTFLDTADYTNGVRIDPTFGYTTAGGTQLLVTNYTAFAVKGTPADSVTVDSLSVYGRSINTTAYNAKGVIWLYSDKTIITNGAQTSFTLFPGDLTDAWQTNAYGTSPSVTASTNYYIGFIPETNNRLYFYYDTGSAGDGYTENPFNNSPYAPTSLQASANTDRLYSMYATYTAAAGNPVNDTSNFFLVF